jgi:N-acetyl-anhydromuramyl-L-alanine amidase AmpD
MKKSTIIFLAVFLAVILPLTFLTIKFFLNQDNSNYTKISWGKPEELKENLILAPLVESEPTADNSLKEAEKLISENAQKNLSLALAIENHLADWGFTKLAERTIDTIIIHSSYDALSGNPYSLEGLIREYKQYGVAPHYLIDRKGTIYRLAEDKNIAFHAGTSQVPDGRISVNDFSLGIEVMNTKTDKPTQEQYASLQKLIDFLKERYKIKYILGHNQIAPGRKDDPWNFDWEKIKK